MKIIGMAAGSDLLIQATKEEVAQMAGFESAYAHGCPEMTIGTTLEVSGIYNNAKAMLTTRLDAAEAAKKLRAAGDRFASFFDQKSPNKKP